MRSHLGKTYIPAQIYQSFWIAFYNHKKYNSWDDEIFANLGFGNNGFYQFRNSFHGVATSISKHARCHIFCNSRNMGPVEYLGLHRTRNCFKSSIFGRHLLVLFLAHEPNFDAESCYSNFRLRVFRLNEASKRIILRRADNGNSRHGLAWPVWVHCLRSDSFSMALHFNCTHSLNRISQWKSSWES
jgi:hypothetical protein